MRTALARLLAVLACPAAVLAVLPEAPVRVVAAATVLGATIALAAVATGWPWLGTLATAYVPTAATAGDVLADSSAGLGRLALGAGLLLIMISSLDEVEEARWGAAATIGHAPWTHRVLPVIVALVGSVLVAAVAAQDVVPSMSLALLGLAAAVGAVALATRGHRPEPPAS